ncbi:hypothetical protein DMUE_2430 [Dictyocoela muelleri]|nr:hypothetical protein DMUE_2430 [Dictyocoela muelleri]
MCKRVKSLLEDSTLCGSKISPFAFLKFAFYFFQKNNFTADYIIDNCDIGDKMYRHMLSIVRYQISEYIKANSRKLGGHLEEVQIDETFWSKRKYNVGELSPAIWIWGAVEFDTGYCYCEIVEKRDVNTLHPIIKRVIKPKSYVVSDKWSAYNNIENVYQGRVCHKHFFVDPETKANTQMIENLWMHLKKIKHYSYGINIDTLQDHLNVFMFFRNYKNTPFSRFLRILLIKI